MLHQTPHIEQEPLVDIAGGRTPVNYKRQVLLFILIFSLIRIIPASIFELGNDEAYYWLYTLKWQWNYFDHPPMVAILGKLFTLNGLLDGHELMVRMGSIIGCALSTWFMFKALSLLHSQRAGWYAAILFNTSFYAGIVSGVLLMPDSPQMVFWTLTIWMIVRILKDDQNYTNWLMFGLAAGLCIMSKVHGGFLWLGLVLYALFQKRGWLKKPHLYMALAVTALVVSPILIWNIQNDFITYRFHSERVKIIGWGMDYESFFNEVAGQFFFNNPVNVALIVIALTINKNYLKGALREYSIFLYTGLPMAVLILFLSLFRPVFPHWSGPAYVSLLPFAAIYLAELKITGPHTKWVRWSIGAFMVFLTCWLLLINFYPGTWGTKNAQHFGKGDVSLDRYGWQQGGKEFAIFFKNELLHKTATSNTPVIGNTWWAAHVEYYFCRPLKLNMLGLGGLRQIHHYAWMNKIRKSKADFSQAFCVVPSDEYYDVKKEFENFYTNIDLVKTIDINRSKEKARVFFIYRLSGWKNTKLVMK